MKLLLESGGFVLFIVVSDCYLSIYREYYISTRRRLDGNVQDLLDNFILVGLNYEETKKIHSIQKDGPQHSPRPASLNVIRGKNLQIISHLRRTLQLGLNLF